MVTDYREEQWHDVYSVTPAQLQDGERHAVELTLSEPCPAAWVEMLHELIDLRENKLAGNRKRNRYYEGKNVLKNLEIAIPPSLANVETVVGWPQKAVDSLAVRSRFDGFVCADDEAQDVLDRLVRQNHLKRQYRQIVQSELIYSCAFVTVSQGDTAKGEPNVLMQLRGAENAAAVWDSRRGRIAYGMTVDSVDKHGRPKGYGLYTDDAVVHFALNPNTNLWDWWSVAHSNGRPTMEVFAYRPTENKPFGQSRITPAVMSLTDSAVREALRTEVAAEFFTSPQKYLLGADADAFGNKTKWEAYIGNIFAIGRDENGDIPQFGQLSQGSMQPHTDYMRSLAARFSGETNVPISQLGVIHDNPSSAEAIYAASEPLIIEAEDLNDGNREALQNIAVMAVAAALGVSVDRMTSEQADIVANFKNPAMPSIVSQADAMIKIASAVPEFADTSVFWEELGFPEDVRRRIMSEIKTATSSNLVTQALLGATNGE